MPMSSKLTKKSLVSVPADGEDAVLRLSDVCSQYAQAANQDCHLWRRQPHQLSLSSNNSSGERRCFPWR